MAITSLPPHPFWAFSVTLYAQPAVKSICLRLQDRCHANVNLVLFCCWLGLQAYRRLHLIELRQCVFAIDRWHHGITRALRRLRQTLKPLSTFEPLYTATLETELCAEHCEQLFLAARLSQLEPLPLSLREKVSNTLANLKNYTHLIDHTFTASDYSLLIELLVAVFPELTLDEIQQMAETRLRP